MYFSAGNIDYWYEVKGAGIPLVLLHGFTGSSATWDTFISSCPTDFQTIVIDLPGHGKTKGNGMKTMEECCTDLFQLFKHLELGTFYLAGYSLGGRTALTYAVQYPETLKGLILESASPGLQDAAERESRLQQDKKLAERIRKGGVEAFVDFWENMPLFDTQKSLPPEVRKRIREERLTQDKDGLVASLEGMGTGAQQSNWEYLKGIPFPVLLVAGERDTKFVRINKEMAARIPDVQFEIIEDAGHAVHIEKPNAFYNRVIPFAKSRQA